ncbi:PQQ-dependent sugar dehydrogenase [Leptospira perolatii]|uniref:PQQ-dependent sugar dehydrogenase n=1 Tax=Leptospira perolatii TaxID=2023191 RepID=UPI001FAF3DDF|nr:PQQ-dependent sugar dehydrogenase [Leptospira perolatii]
MISFLAFFGYLLVGSAQNLLSKTSHPKKENSTSTAKKSDSKQPKEDVVTSTVRWSDLSWTEVGTGFQEPTDIQFLPGQTSSMIILEKRGKIFLVNLENQSKQLIANFVGSVETRSEEGLLGLAFHPDFLKNKLFYLNVVSKESGKDQTMILEFEWNAERILGWNDRRRVLLRVDQPYSNHNAGQLAFGPDRKLYIGLGDGGAANDPYKNGQNPNTFLGSMLRIEPNLQAIAPAYTVPEDNPFRNTPNHLPEIYAYGFRNPWRYSFDSKTGELYVADVGQNLYEEIDLVKKGKNYGWNVKEGFHCFQSNPDCKKRTFEDPIYEYDHSVGRSITGGYVYRGKKLPILEGHYIFADFVSGRIWALHKEDTRKSQVKLISKTNFSISTFGQDPAGELYFADFQLGNIYRLAKKN